MTPCPREGRWIGGCRVEQQFNSDFDALKLLAAHGIRETGNGIIRADFSTLCPDCEAAILYLLNEWDFVFDDTGGKTIERGNQ